MTNTCPHHADLHAFHDGELPPAAAAQFEAHLQSCPACAAELQSLRSLSSLLQGAGRAQFSAAESATDLAAIHAAVDRQPDPVVFRLAFRLSSLAAAVVIACSVRLAIAERPAPPLAAWETTAINLRSDDTVVPASFESWIAEDTQSRGRP